MKNRMIVATMLGMLCNGIAQAAPKSITIVPTGRLVLEKLINSDIEGTASRSVAGVRVSWMNPKGERIGSRENYQFNQKINVPKALNMAGCYIEAIDENGSAMMITGATVDFSGTEDERLNTDDKDLEIGYLVGYSGSAVLINAQKYQVEVKVPEYKRPSYDRYGR